MIKRCEKLAFMLVEDGGKEVYRRMTGFTELSVSKNPKEYSRKYIDEDTERIAVVGYAPAMSYKLDLDVNNPVHKAFAQVADEELLGDDTIKSVVIADISGAGADGKYSAVKRAFSIIPANEGDDTDTYTMSGSLKAAGVKTFGKASTSDGWQTLTFTADA